MGRRKAIKTMIPVGKEVLPPSTLRWIDETGKAMDERTRKAKVDRKQKRIGE